MIDGPDFYVGDEEIGHLHLEGQAHVAIGVVLRKSVVAAKLAGPFRWSTKFVVHDIARAPESRRGASDEDLIRRVTAYER